MRVLLSMEEKYDAGGTCSDVSNPMLIDYLTSFGLDVLEVANRSADEFGDGEMVVLSGNGRVREQPKRTAVEHALIEYALDRDIPVLAFGRGMQVIATHFGGVVTENPVLKVPRPIGVEHPAENGTWIVNHFHQDAVRFSDVPPPLQILLKDTENDTVEGLHCPFRRLLAFQCQPEMPMNGTGQERIRSMIQLSLKNGGFL